MIDGLVSQGWIESNDKTISLHSIASDVISEQNIGKEDSYYSEIRSITVPSAREQSSVSRTEW